jgi:hypothetical protein
VGLSCIAPRALTGTVSGHEEHRKERSGWRLARLRSQQFRCRCARLDPCAGCRSPRAWDRPDPRDHAGATGVYPRDRRPSAVRSGRRKRIQPHASARRGVRHVAGSRTCRRSAGRNDGPGVAWPHEIGNRHDRDCHLGGIPCTSRVRSLYALSDHQQRRIHDASGRERAALTALLLVGDELTLCEGARS